MQKIKSFIQSKSFIIFIWIIAIVGASIQLYVAGPKQFGDVLATHYNNYIIFKQSFFHLIHHTNLYIAYPTEHWDLFKYSPSFSLLFGFFSFLPDWLGLLLWNLLNGGVLLYALLQLKIEQQKKTILLLLFVFIEMLTSVQNAQSNALITGLLILSFQKLEQKNGFLATLFIALTVFIKIFGVVGFILIWLYDKRIKNILYTCMWMILLFILPLLICNTYQFTQNYINWWTMLKADHSASYGLSVMGILHTWFGLVNGKNIVLAIGTILLIIPVFDKRIYTSYLLKIQLLTSILIWLVIFNHKAESPTFVIAIGGIGLWYFTKPFNQLDTILIVICLFLTILSPTDLFPRVIRNQIIIPYTLKALPCLLIWLRITYLQYKSLFNYHT